MPPKRKTSSTGKASPAKKPAASNSTSSTSSSTGRGGKGKKEPVEIKAEPATPQKASGRGKGKVKAEPASPSKTLGDKLREEEQNKKLSARPKSKKYKVDDAYYSSDAAVYEDYSCMLNQTNIGENNNKFYVIQLLTTSSKEFVVFTKWGRVGEAGQNNCTVFNKADDAIKEFAKKFKSKTGNDWEKRDNFQPKSGKYTLLEMGEDDDDGDEVDAKAGDVVTSDCKLDAKTQEFIQLIFDKDMFKDTLKDLNFDVQKMPLGKLSKTQVAKGFDALDELEAAIQGGKNKKTLTDLSSKFYTVIPHNFGRSIPPVINSVDVIRSKREMLLVLGDIVTAQEMDKAQADSQDVKHELEKKYDTLNAQLLTIPDSADEFKAIQKYFDNTKGCHQGKIRSLWKVVRANEEDRFKKFSAYENRKCLWHGTGVAVAAAILKDGLRIMPHSGGRVGKGIYFASEAGKSLGYVRTSQLKSNLQVGIMFLNEVAMGDYHIVHKDGEMQWQQTSAPNKKHSCWAIGVTEPDSTIKHCLVFDDEGRRVEIPQGGVSKQPHPIVDRVTNFSQSEYVVYDEGQVRMRYIVLFSR